MTARKQAALGNLRLSTAKSRLVKDTLFRLVVQAGYVCHRCGGDLVRDDFSIEHKVSWQNSDDPAGLFFDQENIAFSHWLCNSAAGGASRRATQMAPEVAAVRDKESKRRHWTKERRRSKYERLGT